MNLKTARKVKMQEKKEQLKIELDISFMPISRIQLRLYTKVLRSDTPKIAGHV